MPVTSRAKKQRVVIQCVTRTKAECLGASFGIGAVETRLGMDASAGSCAGPKVAMLSSYIKRQYYYTLRSASMADSLAVGRIFARCHLFRTKQQAVCATV